MTSSEPKLKFEGVCPICADSHQRSRVTIVRVTDPKLPLEHYWDEDGVEHYHKPSVIVTEYQCTNGHRFAERSSWQCSECGYKACEAEIVAATEPKPYERPNVILTAAPPAPVRRSSGVVITAAQRAEINRKRGKR